MDWGSEKARLEVEKLQIDLEKYRHFVDYQLRKSKADSKDWIARLAIAATTTIIGIATFSAGQIYQRNNDALKRSADIIAADDRTVDTLLTRLNDSSPSTRIAAATALQDFAQSAPAPEARPFFHFSSAEQAERQRLDAWKRRQSEVLAAATSRLASEDDVHAMEAESAILITAGEAGLSHAVAVNRIAVNELARSAGSVLSSSSKTEYDCDNPENKEHLDQLHMAIIRMRMPFETDYNEEIDENGAQVGPERASFRVIDLLDSREIRNVLLKQCHDDAERHTSLDSKALDVEFLKRAQQIAASSLTIVRIMRRVKCPTRPLHLEKVALVNGFGVKLDLSNASLRGSLLAGVPFKFICQKCDLSYADLSHFSLAQADFSNATTTGTKWP